MIHRKIPSYKFVFTILICTIWIIFFNYSLVLENQLLIWLVIVIIPAMILLSYLFFDPEIFLYAIIFFVPLSVKMDLPGGYALSFPSEALAVLILGYFLVHAGSIHIPDRKIFSHPIFLLLLIYAVWLIICSALSFIPLVSFKRTFIQILYIVVFYFLFYTKFDTKENILKFYLFYGLGLVIPVVNGFIRHSKYHFGSFASYNMPKPFFTEHTIYAASLAFVIPALFYLAFIKNEYNRNKWHKLLFIVLVLLCLVAEFFAYSRAAWLSFLVIPGFLVIIGFKIRPVYLFVLFVFLVIVAFQNMEMITKLVSRNETRINKGSLIEKIESVSNIQTDISNLERINRWKCAIRMFKDRPVTGFGPGTYQFVYYRYQVKKDMTRISTYHGEKGNAHSEYLGYLCETGIPGLLIYLAIILFTLFTAMKIIYRTKDKSIRTMTIIITLCLLTFYVHTIFNGFLENDKIGSLYYGSLAAITAIDIYFFGNTT